MNWKEANSMKFSDMSKLQVWFKIKHDKIPKGSLCVKCKWVFKIKRNGIFCPCLVSCGYNKNSGVDFSETYSPLFNDVTFQIPILVLMVFGLKAKKWIWKQIFCMVILKKKNSWSFHQVLQMLNWWCLCIDFPPTLENLHCSLILFPSLLPTIRIRV